MVAVPLFSICVFYGISPFLSFCYCPPILPVFLLSCWNLGHAEDASPCEVPSKAYKPVGEPT